MNTIIPGHNILFITLDTLRYDIAQRLHSEKKTPLFCSLFPQGWEKRHAPGSFTFASHQAMFAGFLPTPAVPGKHPRIFSLRFEGSETTNENTCVLDGSNIAEGLALIGYKTCCIGGVGFFNKKNPLGNVLPSMFQESYWEEKFGVTEKRSTEYQVQKAIEWITQHNSEKLFLFMNISCLHQPNYFYLNENNHEDTLDSHAAALEYADKALLPLFEKIKTVGKTFVIICSDHGTAYGEDGYTGHRLGHSVVWEVPYAQCVL